MSYDPSLASKHAEQLLVSTATNGDLNVAAAFAADGLGSVVAAGNANIPRPPAPSAPAPAPTAAARARQGPGAVALRLLRWHRDLLTIGIAQMPHGERLHVRLEFAHGVRRIITRRSRLTIHTSRPRAVELRLVLGKTDGPVLKVSLKR
jgi:hypothetical protein